RLFFYYFFFFFFQAEDGIRDYKVTGVQTCALPILDYHPLAIPVPYNHSNIDSDEILYYVSGDFGSRRGIEIGSYTLHRRGIHHRSEERRVGKECRSRWAPYDENKKNKKTKEKRIEK